MGDRALTERLHEVTFVFACLSRRQSCVLLSVLGFITVTTVIVCRPVWDFRDIVIQMCYCMIYRYRAKLAQASFVTITHGLYTKDKAMHFVDIFWIWPGYKSPSAAVVSIFGNVFFSLSFIDNEISNINKISPATAIFKVELLSDATSDVIERFLIPEVDIVAAVLKVISLYLALQDVQRRNSKDCFSVF